MHKNKQYGLDGEKEAQSFLLKKGYKIIANNIVSKFGEIDIIAKKRNTLCFVEVKKYSPNNYADIHYSITKSKQLKIIKTAKFYIAKNNITEQDIRFDAIFITYNNIEHIPGAFFI